VSSMGGKGKPGSPILNHHVTPASGWRDAPLEPARHERRLRGLLPFQHQPRVRLTAFVMLVAAATAIGCAQLLGEKTQWSPIAEIKHWEICESSGLVKSRQHADVFWTHNDSGNRHALFAINLKGETIARFAIEAPPGGDWEDIAIDDAGHLYIGDIGDNHARRPFRTIYKVREPDPRSASSEQAEVLAKMDFRYPDQKYNAESLFVVSGELYMITKLFLGRPTLFHLEKQEDGSLSPRAICSLPVATATAADVSADGKKLAVCGYGQLWVFDIPDDLSKLADAKPKRVTFPGHYQTEACAFDGNDLIVTAESREIWRITAEDIKTERTLP
jgi:hypothetical protein